MKLSYVMQQMTKIITAFHHGCNNIESNIEAANNRKHYGVK